MPFAPAVGLSGIVVTGHGRSCLFVYSSIQVDILVPEIALVHDSRMTSLRSMPPPPPTGAPGIAVWRQIADHLRHRFARRPAREGDRLPAGKRAIGAVRGVNRHTIRAAIAALATEGVLTTRQGQGTTVASRRRLAYPSRVAPGSRRVSAPRRESPGSFWLAARSSRPDATSPTPLGLAEGASVLRLETVSEADGWPLACATHWFDAARFGGMPAALEKTQSITEAFRLLGIADYLRERTSITARHADAAVLDRLKLSPGAIVLQTVAPKRRCGGRPIQYSTTLFAADRVGG